MNGVFASIARYPYITRIERLPTLGRFIGKVNGQTVRRVFASLANFVAPVADIVETIVATALLSLAFYSVRRVSGMIETKMMIGDPENE